MERRLKLLPPQQRDRIRRFIVRCRAKGLNVSLSEDGSHILLISTTTGKLICKEPVSDFT